VFVVKVRRRCERQEERMKRERETKMKKNVGREHRKEEEKFV